MGYRMRIGGWGIAGAVLAAVDLLAFYVSVHPSIWGVGEFSGMAETLVLMLLVYALTPVLAICLLVGMIRRDPLAYATLLATLVFAALAWSTRDSNVLP